MGITSLCYDLIRSLIRHWGDIWPTEDGGVLQPSWFLTGFEINTWWIKSKRSLLEHIWAQFVFSQGHRLDVYSKFMFVP